MVQTTDNRRTVRTYRHDNQPASGPAKHPSAGRMRQAFRRRPSVQPKPRRHGLPAAPAAFQHSITNTAVSSGRLSGIDFTPKSTVVVPSHGGSDPKTKLRMIVVGGAEEVGRNMTIFEYGSDIMVIDMGLQFPEEDMPGIDYIIPNTEYLKGKEKNIRGVIITHGHYDHIGAIPHLAPKLGNPPIFGSPLTLGIIAKRQDDYPGPKLNLNSIDNGSIIKLGCFTVEFFGVSHNIPGSLGVIIRTPVGIIVHTGDFKLDLNPSGDTPADLAKIAKLGDQNVLALLSDSTNASQSGHQLTERDIQSDLDGIVRNSPGRLIIGTFSSNLGRIQQLIWMAEKHERKIIIQGFSMKTNVEIAQKLGYMKIKSGTIIPEQELFNYPPKRIIVLCTGAQGEDNAVLMRIATREHRFIQIEPGDTVVFSSSVIPGNERSVQKLTDTLYREGAEVLNYRMMDIHAGGHAKQEDLKLMAKLVNPKYLIPIEGNHSFLRSHAKAVISAGFPADNVLIVDNGQVVEFDHQGNGQTTKEYIQSDYVFVDGLGVGDVSQIVLRDRQQLAEDGMLVVIATVEGKTGKLLGSPDIISRGFVYMKEHGDLIEDTRRKVKDILKDHGAKSAAQDTFLKDKIRNEIGLFLFEKTRRRPMILPVIIEM
ncbi:MAG: ribonuclease J [bacterium]